MWKDESILLDIDTHEKRGTYRVSSTGVRGLRANKARCPSLSCGCWPGILIPWILRKAGREVALSVAWRAAEVLHVGVARHRRKSVTGCTRTGCLADARGETSSTPAPPPTS